MTGKRGFVRSNMTYIGVGVLIFVAGFFAGQQHIPASDRVDDVYNMGAGKPEAVDFEPFWKAWKLIDEKYIGTEEVTPQEKVWGAIEGLADSLGDPYTVFLPPEEAEMFAELIEGSFGGVGMEIGEKEGFLVVIAPLKNTPAERVGIRAGDIIVSIEEMPTDDLSVDEAVDLIRGEPGTTVTLELLSDGATAIREVTVTREEIVIPTLNAELRSDGIFVISLYNFDAQAAGHFKDAMQEYAQSGATKMILDVRGNPGGFLDAAVSIASYFVPQGEVVVRESMDGKGEEKVHRSKGYKAGILPQKMVVLVDKGSASAAEILAGALSEHEIATLIGEQTFGKGSVQELVSVTPNTALKITVAQWLTPDGTSISKAGLTPDIVVEQTIDDIVAEKDPQMDAAIDFLLK
ncbi:MAG: S41 family peptidase [Patescibacteria group bacterium]